MNPEQPAKEHRFPCKGCGADLIFSPNQTLLQCPHCGQKEKLPETQQEIREYSYNDYLAKPRSRGYGQAPGATRDLRCDGCGAVMRLDQSVRATTCAFCGATMVAMDVGAGNFEQDDVITPEALVPFAISAEKAQEAFKNWIKKLWFVPNALKSGYHIKQLQGMYRPFWTYDAHTVSHWTGERGTYYYKTETYTAVQNGKTVTRTRQVRHTRWTYVSGVYREFFDDVLIKAGKDTDHSTQFQLSGLKPYTPEYLSGFSAERYLLSCEDGWKDAKDLIKDDIESGVRGEIGGDEQRVSSVDTAYSGVTYKHILLPLWLSCYRYGAKTYCFQVNGQTGEVSGARPYSFWKIFLLVIVILAVIAVIVLATK